jgi:transcriptional regulator NrdR family protein
LFCVAQYTTIELPDYGGSFMVKGLSGTFYPFSRDKLYLSLHRALGHRNDATDAATALTSTIIGRVIRNNKTSGGQIAVSMLANTSYMTLKRFDVLAAHSYKAYHLSALKRAKNYSKVLQ